MELPRIEQQYLRTAARWTFSAFRGIAIWPCEADAWRSVGSSSALSSCIRYYENRRSLIPRSDYPTNGCAAVHANCQCARNYPRLLPIGETCSHCAPMAESGGERSGGSRRAMPQADICGGGYAPDALPCRHIFVLGRF